MMDLDDLRDSVWFLWHCCHTSYHYCQVVFYYDVHVGCDSTRRVRRGGGGGGVQAPSFGC